MQDWIVGLAKAAQERRGGVTEADWEAAEAQLGDVGPDELRDLYLQMNGGTFSNNVRLHPLRAEAEPGLVDQSRKEWWHFGERGEQRLFAAKKRAVAEQAGGSPTPPWLGQLSDEDWVYGLRKEATNETKLYKTLEHVLTVLVPPAETEEFGENTFARALTAVTGAIGSLKPKSKKKSKKAKPKAARKAGKRPKKAAPKKSRSTGRRR